ncbi:hypothetical protein [Pseudonocardia sediminis]|nr:hypothetical protein [Pseudonocardia sediminis]
MNAASPPSDDFPDVAPPAPPAPDPAAVGWYVRLARHHLGRGPYLDVGGRDGALLAGLAALGPAAGLAATEADATALRAGAPGCPVHTDASTLPGPVAALTAVGVLDHLPDDALDADVGPGGWFRALEPGGRALVVAADADGRARELLGARWPTPPVPRGHARIRELIVAAGLEIVREGSDGLCRGPYGRVPAGLDPRTAPAATQRSIGRLTLAPGSGESAVLIVRRPA